MKYRPEALASGIRNQSGKPRLMNCNTPLTSAHPNGVQIALADGAVRFVTNNISLTTYKNLADRDDGNAIGDF